jgi:hypothetical protein
MSTPTSLFSRARPGKPTIKKVRGFLSLPGELRNQIYRYCFEGDREFRCEIAAKGSKLVEERKKKTVKLWAGAFATDHQVLKYHAVVRQDDPVQVTIRMSRQLGRYTAVQGLQTNWSTSLFAINLVCKQLHAETLPYIYTKTTFVFDASTRIIIFLNVVPKTNLGYITKLHLHYTTYGCPRILDDRSWQEKHNKSWIAACSSASKKLTGLRNLKIWLFVTENAVRFNLHEPWVAPLLQFRRLSIATKTTARTGRLDTVNIDFRTRWSGCVFDGRQEVARASEHLHELFGCAIGAAILGAKEEDAMSGFNKAWDGEYHMWQFHLGYARTGW